MELTVTKECNYSVEDLFNDNRVLIVDTEVLEDYFSFQFKRLNVDTKEFDNSNIEIVNNVYIFKCFNDIDCYKFAEFYTTKIMKENTFLYVYNKGYDKAILSILINLVLKKESNILNKLRLASDFIIKNNVDYKYICDIHWKIMSDNNILKSEKKNNIKKLLKYDNNIKFWDKFNKCLVNKAEKKTINGANTQVMNIVDIPSSDDKALCSGTKNGKPLPIGLKTIQLVKYGYQVKFDFNKYKSIDAIKNDGHYDLFIKYSANDVISSEKIFNDFVKPMVIIRFYAWLAVNELKTFKLNAESLFSETNTKLTNYLFGIEDKQEIDFNFKDYIPETEIKEFNKLVDFCNDNKSCTSSDLKNANLNTEVIINGCETKLSIGGIHGVKKQYINRDGNIIDMDFASLYPAIIIKFKALFKNIMDVDLYESVKDERIKHKKLRNEFELSAKLEKGLKLLLNSAYGIINSKYKGIAYKPLGLFVCLYGHYACITMALEDKELKPININTDGVYFEVPENRKDSIDNTLKSIESKIGINLDYKYFKFLLQDDVNNYISIDNKDKLTAKGKYNISFKNGINSCSKPISINIENALKLIEGKEITITPIYFKNMLNLNDIPYYFANNNDGIPLIKDLAKPTNVLLNGDLIHVTNDINKANLGLYINYAKLTLDKIYKFDTNLESSKFYDYEIEDDVPENNKLKKQNICRIKKLLDCDIGQIGYCGFMGNLKATTYIDKKPIKQLINYGKTELLNSKETIGLKVSSLDKLVIIDVDIFDKKTGLAKDNIDWVFIDKLKEIETYKTINSETKDFNFKLILKNDMNTIFKIKPEYSRYIEILDNAVVWSLDNPTRIYADNNIEAVNLSDSMIILDNILEVKNDNAKEYIENKSNFEYVNSNTDNEMQIKTALEVLKEYGITVYKVNENSIETSCPYCQNNKLEHYKNNSTNTDAYVNIHKAKSNKGYRLVIVNLSNNCKDDKEHKEFYKKINKDFIDRLPSVELLEMFDLIKEIKENIDKEELNKLNEHLLLKNTVRIIGTGGHKTFQSARKLIENIFVNDIFHIHSTKENKAIKDFENEVKKILNMVIFNRTNRIDNFIDDDMKGFKEIGIHKLININPLDDDRLKNIKGVVTNHKYFYNNGHLAETNKNMVRLIEFSKDKHVEIVLDEYESMKRQGQVIIPLNAHKMYKLDYEDNTRKIYIPAKSCLFPATEQVMRNDENISVFEFAKEYTTQELEIKNDGIYEYNLKHLGGKLDLQSQLLNYCDIIHDEQFDHGRRKPKCIKKGNFNYCYVVTEKVQQYKLKDDISESEFKDSNFLRLLKESVSICIATQILNVGSLRECNDSIDNINELVGYGKELEDNNISFKSFKNQLSKEAPELFVNYLRVRVANSLKQFECDKYYVTANVIKDNELTVNTELAHKSSEHLKLIDLCVIDCKKKGDEKLLKSLIYLKDVEFKSLVFTALACNINKMVNDGVDTKHWRLRTSINDGTEKTKTISYDTDSSEDINDTYKKTVTVSHTNGTESQGRNYSQVEMILLNAIIQVNVRGRIDEDENGKVFIRSIEEETKERLKQDLGRIMRGTQSYKTGIIFGDPELIKELISSYPKDFTVNFNVDVYSKINDREEKTNHAVKDIIDYYNYKLGYSEEEVPHFNQDKRDQGNNKKYDDEEIYKYYMTKLEEHYNTHKKKLKDTEVIPEIISKYGISERQFKSIKKKFKES